MEESTEVLNEVVVKASSQQAEINHIRKSPMAVTVVDGAKLRGRSTGIEEVLTRTSGIKVRKSGGLGSSSKCPYMVWKEKSSYLYRWFSFK